MSTKTLAQKLFIRENYTVLLVNAPQGYKAALTPLPAGAKVVTQSAGPPVDFIQVFAATKAEMDALAARVRPFLKDGGLLWLTYPKAGQMNTDLKREVVWACGQKVGMSAVAQIAVDDVWSALRFKASP
jgi:hypothetical protein